MIVVASIVASMIRFIDRSHTLNHNGRRCTSHRSDHHPAVDNLSPQRRDDNPKVDVNDRHDDDVENAKVKDGQGCSNVVLVIGVLVASLIGIIRVPIVVVPVVIAYSSGVPLIPIVPAFCGPATPIVRCITSFIDTFVHGRDDKNDQELKNGKKIGENSDL